jgi:preprotein translocase subunit SecY
MPFGKDISKMATSSLATAGLVFAFFENGKPFMQSLKSIFTGNGIYHNLILFFFIIFSTYFVVAIKLNPSEIASNLKRTGGFIPGIRPGKKTAEYVDAVIGKLCLPGAIGLTYILIIPSMVCKWLGLATAFQGILLYNLIESIYNISDGFRSQMEFDRANEPYEKGFMVRKHRSV